MRKHRTAKIEGPKIGDQVRFVKPGHLHHNQEGRLVGVSSYDESKDRWRYATVNVGYVSHHFSYPELVKI